MKKLLQTVAWLLIALMAVTSLPVFAAADRVEVKFSVGDSVLSINGEDMQVETPYVVGEGVTLVPLRVITEAFGAEVEWVAETQTINLSYPDVKIVLQIANPVAEVNGKAETLLSAPELTANGYTMVPLRFISETFGAIVSYNDETRGITVVKETAESGTTVIGGVNEKYIGDSFYGWMMENPQGALMEERSFDGTNTVFSFDDNNWFFINAKLNNENDDLERLFIEWKNSLSDYTLVKADKNTSDANEKSIHLQAKDKTTFVDIRIYVAEKYSFLIMANFEVGNTEIINEGVRILDTFDCSFAQDGVYDLSNAANGMRRFELENLGFSMDIPDDYFMISQDSVENEVDFRRLDPDDNASGISISIYSKSDVGTAAELAENDYNNNKKTINENVATYGDLVEKGYENFRGWEYRVEINAISTQYVGRDVFFELGDYVYNVNIVYKTPNNTGESMTNSLLNSIEIKEIDSAKVGILMRNLPIYEGEFVSSQDKWSLTVPNSYTEAEKAVDGVLLLEELTGTSILFQVSDSDGLSVADIRRYMQDVEREVKSQQQNEIVQSTKQVTIGGNTYYEFVYRTEPSEGEVYYVRYLSGLKGGKIAMFTMSFYELGYSKNNIAETDGIIASLTVNR